MAYSPYQVANIQSSLLDSLSKGRQGTTKTQFATSKKMGKMREDYQQELEEAQKRAKAKAKKRGGLFKGLKTLGMFLGPLGAAITGGLATAGQARQQQLGARELLKVDKDRYSRNFLRNPMKEYMEQAEDSQLSSGDVLQSGFAGGLSSFATSKMRGGSKETGGIFKKMRSAREQAGKKIIQNPFKKGQGLFSKGKTPYEGKLQDAFKQAKQDVGQSFSMEDFLKTPDLQKGITMPGIKGGVSQQALLSNAPALQQMLQSYKGLSKGQGLKGATDEMQSAMMLPMLLQLLSGGNE